MMVSAKFDKASIVLVTLYRLQEISEATFFNEFTELLETLSVLPENFIISGDINFHLETSQSNVTKLNDLLDCFNLVQYMNVPTHKKGHTLDFVITRMQYPMVSNTQVKKVVGLSDHFFISFDICCETVKPEYRTITYRNFNSVDVTSLKNDITDSLTSCNISDFGGRIDFYNKKMSSLVDLHAPMKTKTIKIVPKAPWFDVEYKNLRKKRRKAEKKYHKSFSEQDKQVYIDLRKQTTDLAYSKKHAYFSDKIKECSTSKALFSCVNQLVDNTKCSVLPSHESPVELATKFNSFFKEKIENIRKSFPSNSSSFHNIQTFSGKYLDAFRPATLEELQSMISKHGLKCSAEDPIPSKLLLELTDFLLPVWLELINLSLREGSIECLKSAVVLPLLKGLDSILDSEVFKNYRPVSNLQMLEKMIERIVDSRLDTHMDENNLHCKNQYGYKRNHSTETLLLKIVNDLLLACDNSIPTLIMFLDLSAAFDTVDHAKLLSVLKNVFGVRGTALQWLKSFLIGRTQRVLINGSFSKSESLDFGVPQGSILGPKLFNMYAQSFASKMKNDIHVNVEGYADDHQVQKQFSLVF